MLHSSRFSAVLDANVLYPAPLRDYLLRLAQQDLYKPKWTDRIQEEWIRNLAINRSDLKREDLEKTRNAMDSAFPDANITHYEDLIMGLTLPDPNDKHVLAAAIKASVDVIVTCNTKDFPGDYLKTYDIETQHPDEFINNLIDLDKPKAQLALARQAKGLRNPPKSINDILQALEKCGLINSVLNLRS
jgi:hypothetical protein